jgi:hypothetical protein
MVEFYRELRPAGRCMWWGVVIMMTLFMVAWGTGIHALYGAGCLGMLACMFGAAGAALIHV